MNWTKEELIDIFMNNFDCYADTMDDAIPAMTKDRYLEVLKKLNLIKPTIESKNRGCCDECGEGFDNEVDWRYNTHCAVCGHPIPKNKIIKK